MTKEHSNQEKNNNQPKAQNASVPSKKPAPKKTSQASDKASEEISNTKAVTIEKKPPEHAVNPPQPSEKTSTAQTVSWIGVLALLVAITAVALGGYDYWLLNNQAAENIQQAIAQDAIDRRMAGLEQTAQSIQQSTQQALSDEVTAREALSAQQEALNTAWQSMSATLGRTTVAWRLAEVEYLLSIASQRMTLARDRETALSIFEAADQRIRAIADPRLITVRQHIADELTALRALDEPDITGIALNLASLMKQVSDLPLIDKQRIATATQTQASEGPTNWRELPRAIWENIKSLVQVRRHQQAIEPLLPPQEAWFLYQNLRLKLEQARLAVLQRNSALFRQYLKEADIWIADFFDGESTAVRASRQTIKDLAGVELQPEVPDVSSSLRSLREFLAQQGAQQSVTPPESSTPPAVSGGAAGS